MRNSNPTNSLDKFVKKDVWVRIGRYAPTANTNDIFVKIIRKYKNLYFYYEMPAFAVDAPQVYTSFAKGYVRNVHSGTLSEYGIVVPEEVFVTDEVEHDLFRGYFE